MATTGVLLTNVAPSLGCLFATAMLLSPLPDMLQIRKTRSLGNSNPLPFVLTWANCIGWVLYALVIKDPYILPPNILGVLAGMFFVLTSYGVATPKMQDMMSGLMVAFSCYFAILGIVTMFGLSSAGVIKMWGTSADVILLLYYASPLSTFGNVIRTKDSSTIYLPLAITAAANGSMWTAYGAAMGDIFIWMPNMIGAVIGLMLTAVRFIYPPRDTKLPATQSDIAAFDASITSRGEPAIPPQRMDSQVNLLMSALPSSDVAAISSASTHGQSIPSPFHSAALLGGLSKA